MVQHVFALAAPRGHHPEPLHSERRSQLAAGASGATLTVHIVLAGWGIAQALVSAIWYLDQYFLMAGACDAMAMLGIICSILANVGTGAPPKKGEFGYMRWMIGVHLGLVVPPLFALALTVTAALGAVDLSTPRRATACALAVLSSVLALVYIVKLRPRKDAKAGTGLV